MLTLSLLVWLGVIATIATFWWHSDGVKTLAVAEAKRRCQDEGVQLLDHTLFIESVKPMRDPSGGWCMRRSYQFDFTSTGEQRYRGTIEMRGRTVQRIELEPHIMPGGH
ncbi:MAG: hypothetical protein RLZZ385_503 [Pseudomonadota bacterium]|jgi:hypothetical protein